MSSGTRWISISIFACVVLVGCQKFEDDRGRFSSHSPEEIYLSDKVALDIKQISDDNPEFKILNSAEDTFGKSKENLILPKGSKLLAVVDNACEGNGEVTHAIKNSARAHNQIKRQAASIELDRPATLAEVSEMASADPCIVEIANDGVLRATAMPNDTYYSKQLQLTSIKSAEANDILLAPGGLTQDVVIAVIDTGVQLNHPDLKDNLWVDAAGKNGYNFVNSKQTPNDDNGHGTHCAGLAAATTNNNAGVAGVMPTRAKIMAVKALDASGGGDISSIINGIYYAIENKADVISMSLGGNTTSSALRKALVDATNAGVVVFAAAGNSSADLAKSPEYPAAYAKDINGLISVGSVDSQTKKLSSFSNFNKDYVELAAPGSNGILSTYLNGYAYLEGTSMATPIAAGAGLAVVSWLKSHGYSISASMVESIIKAGSDVNSDLASSIQGGRNLNVLTLASSLKANYINGSAAAPVVSPTPTVSPTPFQTIRKCRSTRLNCRISQ